MLVYLDTAQFSWLQDASDRERASFLSEWRVIGCELAISLHVLQEAVKLGPVESVLRRLAILHALQPLRGLPTGSAGVCVREIAIQVAALVGRPLPDPRAWVRNCVFPPMSETRLQESVTESWPDLQRFNEMARLTAELETDAKALPPLPAQAEVPDDLEERLHAQAVAQAGGVPIVEQWLVGIANNVARHLREKAGEVVAARASQWGLDDHEDLGDFRDENDLGSAAGFVAMAREYASDVAGDIGVGVDDVLSSVNQLHLFRAPGASLEAAVKRARRKDGAAPKPSDQTDGEHVAFAPYVDLMFVDKRTVHYVQQEVRRSDDRVPPGAADSVCRARDLDDVLTQLKRRTEDW